MPTANGTTSHGTRKSLADRIERLDGILDGLAEALNASVADAVKVVIAQVVRDAVQAAVKEVLASPELLRVVLHQHAPPPASAGSPPAATTSPATLAEDVVRAARRLGEMGKQTYRQVKSKLSQVEHCAGTAAGKIGKMVAAVGPESGPSQELSPRGYRAGGCLKEPGHSKTVDPAEPSLRSRRNGCLPTIAHVQAHPIAEGRQARRILTC